MNETIRDYDNLFRIFYNYPPILNSTNIAQAYTECKALLNLADMYDALPVTGSRVDHHLLRFSSRLFKQIAKYPPSYLKLGYLARSRIIFSEALIHVVGQWPLALPHLRNSMVEVPETVIELIEDKVDELEELKAKIEARLFRLTLTTSRGERVNPSNAYLDWLAVSLFRQWLAENTTPLPQPILKHPTTTTASVQAPPPQTAHNNLPHRVPVPNHNNANPAAGNTSSPNRQPTTSNPISLQAYNLPNTSRIFRLLGSPSSQAYLPHEELKRFLKIQPLSSSSSSRHHHHNNRKDSSLETPPLYTRETLRKFESKISEIKNLARDLVKPLNRNFLELDLRELSGTSTSTGGILGNVNTTSTNTGTGGLGYLTCTRIEEEDLPWDI
ncbi:hypothetical protein UCRPC4_g06826 [Phaeomoniella chlamydospora]|uniref:Uncharacterized protein n=1 Tax=Phaeomoniella chlamydospora TaxID=158046 RepID=A0A0G2DTC5_PHACM|nr:hypothetical protein UCRPC4_g06826 [Phaeomoniella chlamydospora]